MTDQELEIALEEQADDERAPVQDPHWAAFWDEVDAWKDYAKEVTEE